MRTVTTQTTDAWLSGDYVGASRPMARVTIQELQLMERPAPNHEVYASAIFGQADRPAELPNVKSVKWERSADTDAASCTIELYNTDPMPLGTSPERTSVLGIPGYYTFNFGKTTWSTSRWNQTANGWQDRLVPDRLIRTYEGYGFDATVAPEADVHMYPSGVWLIDQVDYTSDGLITVTCRDVGRLLLDQIMYPPVVPFRRYPLSFTVYNTVNNPDIVTPTGSTTWKRPTYDTDSGVPYVGKNGYQYGHHGSDAFDSSTSTYWLSIGNASPTADYAYEFIQGKFKSNTISAIKFRVWGGPYTVYVSVKTSDGKWQGRHTVPYNINDPVSAPNGANVKFLSTFRVDHEATYTWKPSKPISNVVAVRLTFHNLYNSGLGAFPYRAGVRDFQVALGSTVNTTVDGGTHQEGNYGDYTDIVKKLCCYGGLWWPHSTTDSYLTNSDGTLTQLDIPSDDTYLQLGRAWGDFEATGTYGPATLGVDVWDKKPLKDGINYVRDIVGFIFFIDETGGAIFRSPNIYQVGNIISGTTGGSNVGRTPTIITIDEQQTLIGLTASLNSRSIREQVFVANVDGQVGAAVNGHFNTQDGPFPAGLRRVGGWTDQHFETNKECTIMADLITLRQLFTYRTDKVTVAANPAIQIDDQVQLYEEVTGEGYIHYVQAISSEWDIETGKWEYQLDTHWLGNAPFGSWVFDPANLSPDTQDYLHNTLHAY